MFQYASQQIDESHRSWRVARRNWQDALHLAKDPELIERVQIKLWQDDTVLWFTCHSQVQRI
jgi:hypothetical protein